MKRWLKKTLYFLCACIILFTGLLSFLLTTRAGIYTAFKLSQLYFPGTVSLHKPQGRLLDQFSIEALDYQYKNTHIRINDLSISWDLKTWVHPSLFIKDAKAQSLVFLNSSPVGEKNCIKNIKFAGVFKPKQVHIKEFQCQYLDHNLSMLLHKRFSSVSGNIHIDPIGKQAGLSGIIKLIGDSDGLQAKSDLSFKQEGLYTKLSVKASIQDSEHGRLDLSSSPGYFQLPNASSIYFKGGSCHLYLNPFALTAQGALELEQSIALEAKLRLPHFDLRKLLSKEQSFFGQLTLVVPSLQFLKQTHPDISQISGQLNAFIKAQGTFNAVKTESQLKLSKASLSSERLGLRLDPIELLLQAKQDSWEANALIHSSNNKSIRLKGQGLFKQGLNGNLSLQGQDFPLINSTEYQLNVSPQLAIKCRHSLMSVSGKVLVPYAQIKPHSLTNSLVLSDDVVFKKSPKWTPKFINTQMDILFTMGEKVDIAIKGLQASLSGDIHIKQAPFGPITANGLLSVKQGEYKAYGQILKVEQGQLIYNDSSFNNPKINIRASKQVKTDDVLNTAVKPDLDLKNTTMQNLKINPNTKVGVEVSGLLRSPKIQLFSNPASLSQADILSMILLDRPASQANEAGGQLLIAAITSMNLGSETNGAQLIEQLKQSLGFDLNIQSNSSASPDSLNKPFRDTTSLVVGKSLSKKLYLSYNMGLSQANPNVLTLKYLLNQFFSIQMSNSSTGSSGMDVLYSGSKDKINE